MDDALSEQPLWAVTGFGSSADLHVVLALAKRDVSVRYIVPPETSLRHLDTLSEFYGIGLSLITIIGVDMLDIETVAQYLEGCSTVVNMASFPPYVSQPDNMLWLMHIDMTHTICEAAIRVGVKKLVHCGSVLSLGHGTPSQPADIETPYQSDDSRTVYELSLFRQEMEVWQAATNGLNVGVVCAGWHIGPGDDNSLAHLTIAHLAAGRNSAAPLVSAFIDVRDLAEILLAAASEKYDAQRLSAAGHNTTLRHIMQIAATSMGMRRTIGTAASIRMIAETMKRKRMTRDLARLLCRKDCYSSGHQEELLGSSLISIESSVENCIAYDRHCHNYLSDKKNRC